MRNTLLTLGLAMATATGAWASGITETAAIQGTPLQVISYGSTSLTNAQMAGAMISVQYSNGTSLSTTSPCAAAVVGSDLTCGVVGVFDFSLTPTSSQAHSSGWTFVNQGAASHYIQNIYIDLLPAGAAFIGGSLSHFGNANTLTANGQLSNVVYASPDTPGTSNYYRNLTITFTGADGAHKFDGGETYIFGNDQIAVVVPEPATYGLVGLALAGLGMLRARRKRS